MTREEFIKVLRDTDNSYRLEGEVVIVDTERSIYLNGLTSLPPNIQFISLMHVYLRTLTSLPPGVEFRNGGDIHLDSITSLPPDVQFLNGGDVFLKSILPLEDIDSIFMNRGEIFVDSISIWKKGFKESRWKRVRKKRRVKTFESFSSDI